jgi:hypothetical protein
MNTTIRREGADLVIELTAEGSDGNGVTSGITVTGTVQRMGGSDLYWNSGTNAFDLGSEPAGSSLTHVRQGLYAFPLTNGAESTEQSYRFHFVVTGNPEVNINSTNSTTIWAAPSDATLANQSTIISNIAALNNISAANVWAAGTRELTGIGSSGISSQSTQDIIGTNVGTLNTNVPDVISLANINTQVDNGLSDIFLDQLIANAYNSASPSGAVDSLLNEMTENDGGLTRFTANALEEGGGGGGSSPWTATDVEQARHRLNLDGTQTAPTIGGAAKMAGTDATLTLSRLIIASDTLNQAALQIRGNGSSSGMEVTAGTTTGTAAIFQGAGSGDGISINGGPNGSAALNLQGGFNQANGLRIQSRGGNADALFVQGDGTGDGAAFFSGGGATGSGMNIRSLSTNGDGLLLESTGTGIDLNAPEFITAVDTELTSNHSAGSWNSATGFATAANQTTMQSDVTAIKTKTDALPSQYKKGVAYSNFSTFIVLSSDSKTPGVGLTVTGQIQKDGGSFAALTNSITGIALGFYRVDLTAAEMTADTINLVFSATGADDRSMTISTNA